MKTIAIALFPLLILTGCGKPTPPSVSLHEAAGQGNLDLIQQHIRAESDLNELEPAGGLCPLSIAALFNQVDAAKALVEAGADVNLRNNDGSTPLHTAAFLCRTEIVKVLLDNGVDKAARSNVGATALESVAGPFEDVKGVYDYVQEVLGPMGVQLDYARIKAARPEIADMLR